MRLNELFDNEHHRDGRRSRVETLDKARDVNRFPEHYTRLEQDLAAQLNGAPLMDNYELVKHYAGVVRDIEDAVLTRVPGIFRSVAQPLDDDTVTTLAEKFAEGHEIHERSKPQL